MMSQERFVCEQCGHEGKWAEVPNAALPPVRNDLFRKLDAKSLDLAMKCGAIYDAEADKLLMGPQARHDYVRELLADCKVTCGRCWKELSYDGFYRCSCVPNNVLTVSGGPGETP
jgi:hypothetical protein